MKSFIYKKSILIAIAIISGVSIYTLKKDNVQLSSLSLDNIEAIASGESENIECIAPYTSTCVWYGNIGYMGIKVNF